MSQRISLGGIALGVPDLRHRVQGKVVLAARVFPLLFTIL